jgi:putative transposase
VGVKKRLTAPQRRSGVAFLKEEGLSERRSCLLVGMGRSSYHYRPRPSTDAALLERIRQLAFEHKRFGYRRIWALLRREGEAVNVKRVHRLWKQADLVQSRRRRRKRRKGKGETPCKATHPNHVWTYDFVHDECVNGRKLKILTVEDEHTRYGLALEVRTRMRSKDVIEVLEGLFEQHGAPEYLRSDNGSEFIAHATRRWLEGRGSRTFYIDPGSPWQNPYGESFNGRFREECLNAEVFYTPAEAKSVAEGWRRYYNHERPHSSLGYLTPAEFRRGVRQVGALPPCPRSLSHDAHQDGRSMPIRMEGAMEENEKGEAFGSAHPSGAPFGARVALQRSPILRTGNKEFTVKAG